MEGDALFTEPVLQIENLRVSFRIQNKYYAAVDGVSLTAGLRQGTVLFCRIRRSRSDLKFDARKDQSYLPFLHLPGFANQVLGTGELFL